MGVIAFINEEKNDAAKVKNRIAMDSTHAALMLLSHLRNTCSLPLEDLRVHDGRVVLVLHILPILIQKSNVML